MGRPEDPSKRGARIRLIARADDIGLCRSVNEAAADASEKGILRNISVMPPAPAFEHAAETFRDMKGLCFGLHATVTAEWAAPLWGPVLPREKVPSLVDADGRFFPNVMDLHERKASMDEILAEMQAQLDVCREAGLPIAYVDEHMVFGWLHGHALRERTFRWAEREGLIHSYAHWQGEKQDRGLPKVEETFADPVDEFLARLKAAGPGTYLHVIHPGYDDEEMRPLQARFGKGSEPGAVARGRDADRRCLMDERVVEFCRANGVQPVTYVEAESA